MLVQLLKLAFGDDKGADGDLHLLLFFSEALLRLRGSFPLHKFVEHLHQSSSLLSNRSSLSGFAAHMGSSRRKALSSSLPTPIALLTSQHRGAEKMVR